MSGGILEQHPFSARWPAMPDVEFAALVADIRANGLRDHGWLYEGKVLDGWHRYRACQIAGRAFRTETYTGSDPAGFVKSKNLHRRHLTLEQRLATVEAELVRDPTQSDRAIAAAAKVSPTTVGKVRSKAETAGTVSTVDTITGKDGVKQPAKKAPAKGKPVAPKKPRSDPKDAKIAKLEAELAESKALVESLKDDVERSLDASEVARDQAEAAAELLATEPAKVLLKYKAEIRRLEQYRDDLLNQNGHMVKQIKVLERKLAKYEGKK